MSGGEVTEYDPSVVENNEVVLAGLNPDQRQTYDVLSQKIDIAGSFTDLAILLGLDSNELGVHTRIDSVLSNKFKQDGDRRKKAAVGLAVTQLGNQVQKKYNELKIKKTI